MKFFILFLITLMLSGILAAQQITYGPQAGLNLSFASAKKPDMSISGSPGIGFHLGGFADISINDQFSFHPQLLFSYESCTESPYGDKASIHVFYLKIPLDVVYHSSLADSKLFFGLGPYIAVALSGKYKPEFNGQGESVPIVFGNDSLLDDLKRLDAGINLMVGYYVTEQLFITAAFDLGLPDVSPADNVKAHTRSFGITAGYLFGGSKK